MGGTLMNMSSSEKLIVSSFLLPQKKHAVLSSGVKSY